MARMTALLYPALYIVPVGGGSEFLMGQSMSFVHDNRWAHVCSLAEAGYPDEIVCPHFQRDESPYKNPYNHQSVPVDVVGTMLSRKDAAPVCVDPVDLPVRGQKGNDGRHFAPLDPRRESCLATNRRPLPPPDRRRRRITLPTESRQCPESYHR